MDWRRIEYHYRLMITIYMQPDMTTSPPLANFQFTVSVPLTFKDAEDNTKHNL